MVPSMSRRRIAATSVALALLAAAAWWARQRSAAPVVVAAVGVQEVVEEVRGPGVVDARIVATVGARISGVVSEVLVDVGDHVAAGALLARLEDSALRARLAAARSAAESSGHALAAAEAESDRTASALELARRTAIRQRSLAREGVVPEAVADEAETGLNAAEAANVSARASLSSSRSELARARHELEVAEIEASYSRIVAPFAGLVTARRIDPGVAVLPGGTVIELLDPTTVWVAAWIDESLIGRLALGQPARLHLRSGWQGVGTVARLSRRADPVARELEVDVSFTPDLERLTLDEEAEVAIEVSRVAGLAVPTSALVTTTGESGVFVARDRRAVFVPVRVGRRSTEWAAIEDELAAGELVILDPKRLTAGARVRLVAER